MKNLITRVQEMIAERDEEIVGALSEEQRKNWVDLEGEPLQVKWNAWDLLTEPFE